MSGIAELCLRLNFAVSGCDLHSTSVTQRLGSLGAQISTGHHSDHISTGLDAVVISSAVKFSNPEVQRARELRIPVIPGPRCWANCCVWHVSEWRWRGRMARPPRPRWWR